MAEIIIDQNTCTGCGACIELCSVTHVYRFENKKAKANYPSRCWGCGQCVAACPVDAIDHSNFPLKDCPEIFQSGDDLDKLVSFIRERRSNRVYQNKQIARKIVEELVNNAKWAPSGRNLQAVSWIAVDDIHLISALSSTTVEVLEKEAAVLRYSISERTTAIEKKITLMEAKTYEQLGRRLRKGEKPIFFNAPVVLFALTPRSHFGRDDAILSGYTMQLAAVQMGLSSCQVGYFIACQAINPATGNDLLNIPDGYDIQMVLTLGYPKYKMRRVVKRSPLSFEWVNS